MFTTELNSPVTHIYISTRISRMLKPFAKSKFLWGTLKLFCGYKYTRIFMFNCGSGLKQLRLQVNGHAWFHLQGFRRPVRKGNKRTIHNENIREK